MSEQLKPEENKGASDLWYGIDLKTCDVKDFCGLVGIDPNNGSILPKAPNPKAREDFAMGNGIPEEFNERFAAFVQGQQQPPAPASTPEQPAQFAPAAGGAEQPQGQQPQAGSQPAAAPAEPTEEFVEITGKIPKSKFGTYLTGRNPVEAVIAALDGNVEKDRTLKTFIDKHNSLSTETLSLRQQLLDTTIKMKEAAAKPAQQAPVQPFQVPHIEDVDYAELESIDLYNPDNHAAAMDGIRKLIASHKATKQAIETQQAAAKAQPSPAPEAPFKPEEDADVQRGRVDIGNARLKRDIDEIEIMVATSPELKLSKSFVETDTEVKGFHDGLQRLSGLATADAAVNLYFGNSPEAQRFRDACTANKVAPPSDYDKHQVIFRAYNNRKKDMETLLRPEVAANPPPEYSMLSYSLRELSSTPKRGPVAPQQPQPAPAGYQQKIQDHVARETAAAVPPGVIPDIPPTVGSTPVNSLNENQQMAIAMKAAEDINSLTKDEAIWYANARIAMGEDPEGLPTVLKQKLKQ